jgi:sortase A
MKALRRTERLLLFAGLILLAIFIGGQIHRSVLSREELDRFRELQAKGSAKAEADSVAGKPLNVDFSLWSEGRIAAYKQSLLQQFAPPLAVLRIPKLQLEVAVLNGTDELSLNRGVGHISGTAYPGEEGNIGVAGHRDGFFRGLKDIKPGDIIELQSLNRSDEYRVERIVIVGPKDVSVLQPKPAPSLTLVTCYPFYFIGSAPQRYIVEAWLADFNPAQPQSQPAGHDKTAAATTRFKPAAQKVNSKSQTLNKEKTQ